MTSARSASASFRPELRLVAATIQEEQQRWYTRADRDLRRFLVHKGHALSDPSLAHWAVELCAELSWESRRAPVPVGWSSLRIAEAWARLANLHWFFPQPRLMVAFHDTVQWFLPWLAEQGRLDRASCICMLEQLERVRMPLLEQAREQLAARHRFRERSR